ncbi:MAG: peptidase M50, partial [Myxococcales bacterium]|nr:peptidase M50 [Myxococcales bacterium]
PGLVKLAAFNVMAIGGVSTLLFNGNPLLRFDGYYVLSDWLEIPNLADRSSRFLRYLGETHVLGLPERRGVEADARVRSWLLLYGVLAFAYRIVLSFSIVLLVAGKFFSVGVALAVWSITLQFGVPLFRGLARLRFDPRVSEKPFRVVAGATCALLLLLLIGFGLPLPLWTIADGVVWLPEHSQVRTGSGGMVHAILATPGQRVARGDPLLEIRDPILAAKVRVLEARVREATAEVAAQGFEHRVAAELARSELAAIRAELAQAKSELGDSVVRAGADGKFVLPNAEDLMDRFFEKGAVIGYLALQRSHTLRVVVRQEDAAWVRNRTETIEVRLPGRAPLQALFGQELPQATQRLPSLALGSAGGGGLAVDQRDGEGLTATEALFQFDVLLPAHTEIPGLGLRAKVRFEHGLEPLGYRMLRALRRLFLRRLHV